MSEGEGGPSFESTPSWVIGAVVFVIVGISLGIDKLLDNLGQVLKRNEKKPLQKALKKIKEELMLMGFVSLLLAFVQDKIQHLCIPEPLSLNWLPCDTTSTSAARFQVSVLSDKHRVLGEEHGGPSCPEGMVPFISLGVLHDLHFLIFILAIVHVVSCTIIVLLGEAKISQWLKWEESIRHKSLLDDDRSGRIIDIRTFTFIRDRFEGVDAKKRNYIFSFFKHLAGVVTKADYEAMRFGFILTHRNGQQRFNFHKYMVYAYEADFHQVVSISWYLWLFAAISLTLNVAGWNIHFWLSVIPLFFLLVVGTKLEQVITDLAIYLGQRHSAIIGDIQIQPSDDYFWFKRPRIIHSFIHAILFMNSFGFAIFFWTLFKFGFNSCVMGDPKFVAARLVFMVAVQAICSYSTLPLYAIVTQMGSSYNQEAMLRYANMSSHGARVPEHTSSPPAYAEISNE